jgi:hypothetical protein
MISGVRVVATVGLLLSLLACAGAGQPKPVWVSAPEANIPALSTFALAEAVDDRPATVLDTQVRNALRTELMKKGYAEASADPDFVVSYQPVAYEARAGSSPVTVGIGMGTWGRRVGGSVGAAIPIGGSDAERVTHRLTIRAEDPEGRRELWVGTTTSIEPPAETQIVTRAVAGVMRGFPPRRD